MAFYLYVSKVDHGQVVATQSITSPDNSSSQRTAHKRDAETNRGADESSSKVCPGMRMSLLLNSKQLPLHNAQLLKCDIIIMVPSEVLLLSSLFPPLITRNPHRTTTCRVNNMIIICVLFSCWRQLVAYYSVRLSLCPYLRFHEISLASPRAAILVNTHSSPALYILLHMVLRFSAVG